MFKIYISDEPYSDNVIGLDQIDYDLVGYDKSTEITENIDGFVLQTNSVCIFDDEGVSDELYLLNPKLKLERNSAGSLTFSILNKHPYFNSLEMNRTTITVTKENDIIFHGRIINISDDFYKTRSVQCEGCMNYLHDIVLPLISNRGISTEPSEGTERYIKILLDYYNELQSLDSRKIEIGDITVKAPETSSGWYGIIRSVYNVTAYEGIIDYLLEENEGTYFEVSIGENGKLKLNYHYESENIVESSQYIEFGENLLDYTTNLDINDIFTVMKPVGNEISEETWKNGNIINYIDPGSKAIRADWWQWCYSNKSPSDPWYLYSEDENKTQNSSIIMPKAEVDKRGIWNPSAYLDYMKDYLNEHIYDGKRIFEFYPDNEIGSTEYICNVKMLEKYGPIIKTIDFKSKDYDEDTTHLPGPHSLLKRALDFFSKVQFENVEIQITAFDLNILNNNIQKFNIGDYVTIKSDFHGTNMKMPVESIEYDFLKPSNTKISLNKKPKSNLTTLLKEIK